MKATPLLCEIVASREPWRMKTSKGLLYAVREIESDLVFYVFIRQRNKQEMSCTCGKQAQSRLCPHIQILEKTLYLPKEVEGSLVFVDTEEVERSVIGETALTTIVTPHLSTSP